MIALHDRHSEALYFADIALQHYLSFIYEPRDYETFRWRIVEGIQTGALPQQFSQAHRQTPTDLEDLNDLLHRTLCQKTEAHVALCYEALGGSGKMTKQSLEDPRLHRREAAVGESI